MPPLRAKGAQSTHILKSSEILLKWVSCSNLTFGAGGKDKDGNNIAGWGYYEVCNSAPSFPF